MIPKKPAPDLIRGRNRFSEKHALGLDPRDHAQTEKHDRDQVGFIDANTRAVFGRSYASEPDVLVKELAADEAIAAADTLLMTIPNTLGVEYNAHVIESVLKYVAPKLGWR